MDVPLNSQNSHVYGFENKDNIQDNHLFHHTNRHPKKAVVSVSVMWKGTTKSFFQNDKGLKVNSKKYKEHLEKDLPEVNCIMNNNTWVL